MAYLLTPEAFQRLLPLEAQIENPIAETAALLNQSGDGERVMIVTEIRTVETAQKVPANQRVIICHPLINGAVDFSKRQIENMWRKPSWRHIVQKAGTKPCPCWMNGITTER